VFNIPWTFTGHPTVSIPVGRTADGLPWSMQIIGKDWKEQNLLLAAAWIEQRLHPDMKLPPEPEMFTFRDG
jgi:aspartyl-tRNA(Asn)/glutamyl-tRNA(Gln) amidotransferase subunit A